MSDSAIKRGDLVAVMRPTPCCGGRGAIGAVFRVTRFTPMGLCGVCSAVVNEPAAGHAGALYALSRLDKINPERVPDAVQTAEGVCA